MAAEREVIYRIKAVNDPSSKAGFDALAKEYQSALQSMGESRKKWMRDETSAVEAVQRARKTTTLAEEREDKAAVSRIQTRARFEQRALDDSVRNHERAMAQIRGGNAKLTEGFFGTVEGLGRLARGFTLLGFTADENLQKLIMQLSAVQGIVDLTVGGIKVYQSITKAVEGYQTALIAAAVAETTLSAARSRSAAVGANDIVSGAVSGAAGGAVTSAAGGSGAGLAGVAIPAAAAAAALASVAAAGKVTYETLQGISRYGFRGGTAPGTWSDSIGGGLNSIEKWGRRTLGYSGGGDYIDQEMAGEDRITRQQKQLQIAREQRENRRREREEFMGSLDGMERPEALKALRQRLNSGEGLGGDPTEKLQAERSIRMEIFNLEKQAAREKIDAGERAVQAAKQEMQTVQQMIASRQEALKSAAERFADLDPGKQRELIGIKEKADRHGAESLSREERIALRGIGTETTSAISRRGSEAELDRVYGRGFFDETFAADDVRRTGEMQQKVKQLLMEIKTETEFKVRYEFSESQLRDAIQSGKREQEALIREIIRQEFGSREQALKSREMDRNAARRGVIGGP